MAAGIIALVTFLLLAVSILVFPEIKIGRVRLGTYWMVALLGAVVLLAAQLVPIGEVWRGLTEAGEVNPLKILALFFAMTFLSVVLDEVGLFRYLAARCIGWVKKGQWGLFLSLYALAAVLTVFTSNDIVILTLTPFLCFFCKNAKINPIPYLVGEFAAANTWSMLLIIGNPTNIYLATSASIDFISYLQTMAAPTLVSGVVQLALLCLLFCRSLSAPASHEVEPVRLQDKPDLIAGLAHLGVCLVCLVISGYVGIPMWLVAVACAASLLLCMVVIRLAGKGKWKTLLDTAKRLPWQLIPFVLGMFVIVICLQYQGISAKIGQWLGDNACVWTYGASSYLAANLINNIPMSILYSTLPVNLSQNAYMQAIYASIVGSNLGALLTPVGALAGIMFTGLTRRYEVRYSFLRFILYGALVSIPTLALALGLLSAFV